MPTSVSFPSADFPAFPTVTVEIPDGWHPVTAHGSLLAVALRTDEGEFSPNVVVAISRFTREYELGTAIEAVSRKYGEQKDVHEIGREEREVLGVPGFRIEATYADERVGTLVQATHLAVVRQAGAADLVQITGTCTGTQARELWPVVRGIIDSATGGAA